MHYFPYPMKYLTRTAMGRVVKNLLHFIFQENHQGYITGWYLTPFFQ